MDRARRRTARPLHSAECAGRRPPEMIASIVSIHDYGEDGGLAFIAMEFINGKELRKRLRIASSASGSRTSCASMRRHSKRWTTRIASGVVHRDIKPVEHHDHRRGPRQSRGLRRGQDRVVDDDAGRDADRHAGIHVAGTAPGTSGQWPLGPLFAGVILYQFLTGERPFTGDGYAIIQQVLMQDAIPPSKINLDVPRALDPVADEGAREASRGTGSRPRANLLNQFARRPRANRSGPVSTSCSTTGPCR